MGQDTTEIRRVECNAVTFALKQISRIQIEAETDQDCMACHSISTTSPIRFRIATVVPDETINCPITAVGLELMLQFGTPSNERDVVAEISASVGPHDFGLSLRPTFVEIVTANTAEEPGISEIVIAD